MMRQIFGVVEIHVPPRVACLVLPIDDVGPHSVPAIVVHHALDYGEVCLQIGCRAVSVRGWWVVAIGMRAQGLQTSLQIAEIRFLSSVS